MGWFARGQNNGMAAQNLTVQAICLVNLRSEICGNAEPYD